MRKPDHTASAAPAVAPDVAVDGTVDGCGRDVFGLEDAAVLGFVVEQRRRQDAAAAAELRGVTAWADRHRVADPETDGHGSVDPEAAEVFGAEAIARARAGQGWSFAGPDGVEGLLRLCGQGAYLVSEFAVTELATALGMSETGARRLVGQALELRDRLPRLWSRVMSGQLPAWKARRVAEQTIPLAEETAAWVDAQLEAFAHKLSLHRIEQCVTAAVVRFEPERAAEQARKAAETRGVWTEDHLDGTSTVTARTGTPDAAAFDKAVGQVASDLAALGDTDDLDIRRAKAVGVLADPQGALDLETAARDGAARDDDAERPSRPATGSPAFHLHVRLSDAATSGLGSGLDPVVRLEAPGIHGPVGLAAVEQWLRDLAPDALIKLTPVVDLGQVHAVDAYEIPARVAEVVEHRDLVCQFPWCGRRGRHDKDHIIEYLDPDDGGPPGQTNTENLARLCRYHHRVKTHSDWTYRREPDGSLTWTSPLSRHYRVDPTGTTNL